MHSLFRWNERRKALVTTHRGPIAEWVVTFLLLIFFTTTLAQAFVIPSSSMEDTLMTGDHVIVDKLSYSPSGPISRHFLPYQEVRRGDIIVFRYPVDISKNYVKRVIGVPGDRIRIVDKQLILNGHAVNEPYKYLKTGYIAPFRDNFPASPEHTQFASGQAMLRDHTVNGELIVPQGQYFALGDNRDYSEDSRYWGFVPRENIIGKPVIVYWSYESTTERLSGSPINPDHLIDLAQNFFSKTRWDRTFRLVRGHPVE
ncbi:MAG: signal peptidase I [Chloroflexia bacterium]